MKIYVMALGVSLISSTVLAQSFTGQVYGGDRFGPSQTTLPSAAIDIPRIPSIVIPSSPSLGSSYFPTLSPALSPAKAPLFKFWDAWHDPIVDDNPDHTSITPWIRSFLPKRATKNIQ